MGSRDYLPRAGRYSDWQLYRRLLSYAAPYWLFFLLSFAGYALYSAGVVLLAAQRQAFSAWRSRRSLAQL